MQQGHHMALDWMLSLLFAALGLALGFLSSVMPIRLFLAAKEKKATVASRTSESVESQHPLSDTPKPETQTQRKAGPTSSQSTLEESYYLDRTPMPNTHCRDFEVCSQGSNEFCQDSKIANGILKPDPYNPCKRQGYLSWDDYFMAIAFLSAHRSKDPNRQVGACLVSQDRVILGIGYNGFPRGCSDDELPWAKVSAEGDPLKTKYPYVCHAEVNAILNKNHASASGQRLYVTMFPCNECAKIIIQAGVAEVVYFIDKNSSLDCSFTASRKLLAMVWRHQPAQKKVVLEFK